MSKLLPSFLLLALLVIVISQSSTQLYELLEVDEKATSNQIKKAFRRLSVKYHPDRHAGDQEIQKKYVRIKFAYETLIDVSKRITYDLHGQQGLKELEKTPLRKGGDFRTEMWIPLEKFYTGGDQVYSFRRGQICKNCQGKQGLSIIIAPRDLKFHLEKGMRENDVVLFKGQSEQGFDFYPGDVFVKLHQVPHATLKRDGNNLRTNLDISLKDAILGFERSIPHLDGHNVFIEESEDIQDGKVIEIENQGMPIRGQMDKYGSLLATIRIKHKRFTEQELQKIRKIFQAGRKGDKSESDSL